MTPRQLTGTFKLFYCHNVHLPHLTKKKNISKGKVWGYFSRTVISVHCWRAFSCYHLFPFLHFLDNRLHLSWASGTLFVCNYYHRFTCAWLYHYTNSRVPYELMLGGLWIKIVQHGLQCVLSSLITCCITNLLSEFYYLIVWLLNSYTEGITYHH